MHRPFGEGHGIRPRARDWALAAPAAENEARGGTARFLRRHHPCPEDPGERKAIGLFDKSGQCITRLSQKAEKDWADRLPCVREIRVLAMVCRKAEQDGDEACRKRCPVPEWEVPVAEVMFENHRR